MLIVGVLRFKILRLPSFFVSKEVNDLVFYKFNVEVKRGKEKNPHVNSFVN